MHRSTCTAAHAPQDLTLQHIGSIIDVRSGWIITMVVQWDHQPISCKALAMLYENLECWGSVWLTISLSSSSSETAGEDVNLHHSAICDTEWTIAASLLSCFSRAVNWRSVSLARPCLACEPDTKLYDMFPTHVTRSIRSATTVTFPPWPRKHQVIHYTKNFHRWSVYNTSKIISKRVILNSEESIDKVRDLTFDEDGEEKLIYTADSLGIAAPLGEISEP